MNASTVPVTITPEAAARVAELGMQAQLEQMIEHTRQTVSELRDVRVVLESREPSDEGMGITVFATTTRPYHPEEQTMWDRGGWKVRTFPPEVCQHFVMMLVHENDHAG